MISKFAFGVLNSPGYEIRIGQLKPRAQGSARPPSHLDELRTVEEFARRRVRTRRVKDESALAMFTADRMTHLAVVVGALVCASLVVGIGTAARITDGLEAAVLKPGKPVTASTSDRTIH